MLKGLGSLLILVACTGIGFGKSRELQRHLEQLEEIKRLFYLLRSELQYTRAPFAEVFEKISKKTKTAYAAWLKSLSNRLKEKESGSFWNIWTTSITESLSNSGLKPNELEDLQGLGKNLEYTESLDLYLEQLEYHIKHTREDYRSKRKLCQSMGIMGGIFLVILLL